MFQEMARALARKAVSVKGAAKLRAEYIFRRCLTRPPSQIELKALVGFFDQQRKRFESGQLKAAQIAGDKKASADQGAWTMVARVVLNLDEMITRQ